MNELIQFQNSNAKEQQHLLRDPKKNRLKLRKTGVRLFLFFLLLFPIAHFLLFYVAVNFNSILMAFQRYEDTLGNYVFSGMINFKTFIDEIVNSIVLRKSAVNSVILYLSGLLIGAPLNILISYALFKKVPMHGIFRVILFLPAIISGVVFVLIFKYFVELGIPYLAAKLFGNTDFKSLLTSPGSAFPMMIFFSLWTGFGLGTILYSNAMTRIPDSLIEVGQLEGISPMRELWNVVVPMIFPTITTFLVTGIAGLFTNGGPVYTFYQYDASYDIYTLGYYFYIRVVGKSATFASLPYAAAAGLIFTFIAAPVTLLAKHLLEKFGPSPEY